MALVLEHARDDLLDRPLAVDEPHLTCGRHRVELLVGEVPDRCERLARGRETREQDVELDLGGAASLAVPSGLVVLAAVADCGDESGDPVEVVGGVRSDGAHGAVTQPFAARAWSGETCRAGSRQPINELGDLAVGRVVQLLCAPAHTAPFIRVTRAPRRP
jgi:hypothetical protein